MRILLTGITGFAGSHLAEALLAGGNVVIHGTSRQGQWPEGCGHLAGRVTLSRCDLCERDSIAAVLREAQPERIFHLAGYANAGQSFREPEAAWTGNLTATRRLYEAVHQWGGRPRIVSIGSGLIYGDADTAGETCDENHVLRPVSPYAASKAAADLLGYQCSRAPGLDIVRVRAFNHIGPRQSPQYAVAHFAQQIAAVERRQRPPVLETGDLASCRDLTDVRDMVRAYILLADRGRTGEAYNVAAGAFQSMGAVLERLLAMARTPIEVCQRPNPARVAEKAALQADTAKLRRETGWTQRYALDQTLADTLAYWRQR